MVPTTGDGALATLGPAYSISTFFLGHPVVCNDLDWNYYENNEIFLRSLSLKDMPCLNCRLIEMGEMACYTERCSQVWKSNDVDDEHDSPGDGNGGRELVFRVANFKYFQCGRIPPGRKAFPQVITNP